MVRIDYREKALRKKEKTMEFIWQPFYDIDKGKANILTHVTYGHYNPEPKIFGNSNNLFWRRYYTFKYDDRDMEDIYEHFLEVKNCYRSNHILHLYGDDFSFKKASTSYNQSD